MQNTPIIGQVALALGAAVFTQIANILFQVWTGRRTQTKDASHLAIRMAGILETFAIMCADQIAENRAYIDTNGNHGNDSTKFPELAPFPDDATWKSMDRRLLGRAITLRSEVLLSVAAMSGMPDFSDTEETLDRFNGIAGVCGYRAWMLAEHLRARYGYPLIEPKEYPWDPTETLKEQHDKEIELRRQNHEWAANWKAEQEKKKRNEKGPDQSTRPH